LLIEQAIKEGFLNGLILEAIEEKDKASLDKDIEGVNFWVKVRRWLESH